ncbi:MAG: SHOCT domain-containing protein [Desulfosporosinus sp.]|nr:SHOCT domain-containing protein [Desulfosporosinus sp.]
MMFIGIVIFLIGLFLVFDFKKLGMNGSCFCKSEDKAMDTLRERYARSEITSEEFITMKNTLN